MTDIVQPNIQATIETGTGMESSKIFVSVSGQEDTPLDELEELFSRTVEKCVMISRTTAENSTN